MSDSPLDRVQDLFDRAVVLPEDQRGAFLDAACAGDANLRAEVESLLRADESLGPEDAAGIIPPPVLRRTGTPTGGSGGVPVTHPEHIGPFRIIRFVAAGGMAVVYEAEQDNPRRRVALKIVHPGSTSQDLLRRCEAEAQILGKLHHPGIPQVYAAGTVPDGRPYFAMEFIDGPHLDEYARRGELSVRDRIELMARVCDAVHHAHEQGIIHRDLKPANVLVDEAGQPKVLDFGVARITTADRMAQVRRTQTGQFLGTLNYISPEQFTGPPGAADLRVDVYSLGVILFELLTGRPPSLLEAYSIGEATRVLRDVEAPKLGALHPALSGDVETIAATALEKDPRRRYQSVAELAADLRRHLADEPIAARPPSALYQLRKFVRRNVALVSGLAATGLALVIGLVGTLLFAFGESRQKALAERHEREAIAAKSESEHQAYRARIAAATMALSSHDVEEAGRHLAAAPEHLRGWEWRHLNSRLDESASVVPLPAGDSPFLLGTPDRLRAGVWTRDGLHLTDLEGGGKQIVPIGDIRHDSHVTAAQTLLGLRLAGWVGQNAVQLQDEGGRVVCRVEVTEGKRPEALAISPDGLRLATAWEEAGSHRLGVFDAKTGRRIATCAGHPGKVWGYSFSPDGERLASAGDDRVVRVWAVATGQLVATCQGHTARVVGVMFRPDGARLLSVSTDGTVRQWDSGTGKEVEQPHDRHSGPVAAASYSPCGQWVVSGGFDRTVRVWRADSRQDAAVLHGHTGPVVRVGFGADAGRVASAGDSWISAPGRRTVATWDVNRQTLHARRGGHTGTVETLAFSADGRWLATGGSDKTVRVWDAATGVHRATLQHSAGVLKLAFGPDGTWLVTVQSDDNRVRVWDIATGRVRKEIHGPSGYLRSVALSPDGKRVAATASVGGKHHVHVVDVESGERLFSGDGGALCYSPDGRWLAVQDDGEWAVRLLDARNHEVSARLRGHERIIWAAAFSPDSRHLATCGRDRTIRLWPVAGGESRVLQGHTADVYAVAFHPDGKRLATAGQDRAIWLWDLERGEDVVRLQGHTSYVRSLAFHPDGTTLASGAGDFTMRLWDAVPPRTRQMRRGN